jgi:rubrerythrin
MNLQEREGRMFTAKELLDIAVRLERNGDTIYRQAIEKVTNPELASLLEWMADEEVKHAEYFEKMKSEVTAAPTNEVAEEFGRKLFNEMLGDQSFSLKDVDFRQIDQVNDMITTFIEFEKDTVLFYKMLDAFVDNEENQETLRRIIDEENRHIERLQDFPGGKLTSIAGCK